jgi:hypothetical protein
VSITFMLRIIILWLISGSNVFWLKIITWCFWSEKGNLRFFKIWVR